MRIALIGIVLALAAPATAAAGGFATVGLEPPAASIGPGDTWTADLTVLQHGVTPMENLSASVVIRRPGGGESATFKGKETGEPGVYRAQVVFPEVASGSTSPSIPSASSTASPPSRWARMVTSCRRSRSPSQRCRCSGF